MDNATIPTIPDATLAHAFAVWLADGRMEPIDRDVVLEVLGAAPWIYWAKTDDRGCEVYEEEGSIYAVIDDLPSALHYDQDSEEWGCVEMLSEFFGLSANHRDKTIDRQTAVADCDEGSRWMWVDTDHPPYLAAVADSELVCGNAPRRCKACGGTGTKLIVPDGRFPIVKQRVKCECRGVRS